MVRSFAFGHLLTLPGGSVHSSLGYISEGLLGMAACGEERRGQQKSRSRTLGAKALAPLPHLPLGKEGRRLSQQR